MDDGNTVLDIEGSSRIIAPALARSGGRQLRNRDPRVPRRGAPSRPALSHDGAPAWTSMPRIRSIRPEFWSDSLLSRLPALTRLVYICLWSMADDEGRLEGDAETVWHFGFPREPLSAIENALRTLSEHSRIVLYRGVSGPNLIALPKFLLHQRIDKPYPSKLPAPQGLQTIRGTVEERSPLEWSGKGMEGSGNGSGKIPGSASLRPGDLPPASGGVFSPLAGREGADPTPPGSSAESAKSAISTPPGSFANGSIPGPRSETPGSGGGNFSLAPPAPSARLDASEVELLANQALGMWGRAAGWVAEKFPSGRRWVRHRTVSPLVMSQLRVLAETRGGIEGAVEALRLLLRWAMREEWWTVGGRNSDSWVPTLDGLLKPMAMERRLEIAEAQEEEREARSAADREEDQRRAAAQAELDRMSEGIEALELAKAKEVARIRDARLALLDLPEHQRPRPAPRVEHPDVMSVEEGIPDSSRKVGGAE